MSERKGWVWLRYAEPARLRAGWAAVVAAAAAVGVTVSSDVDAKVGVVIGVVGVVVAVAQGEWTRLAVYAPRTVDRMTGGRVAPPPDLP